MTTIASMPGVPPALELEQRVLVLAPFGRDAAEIGRVLGKAGFVVVGCQDVEHLCTAMEQGAAVCVLAEEALSEQARERIVATLAHQPSWSDLPLLIMSSRSHVDRDGWHALRGLDGLGQTMLLERPVNTATLVSAVRTVAESRRRQYEIRDELATRRRAEQEVNRQRELLQKVLDTIPVMLVTWSADLQRFTLNHHAEAILGWTTSDANQTDFLAWIYPDPEYRADVCAYMHSLHTGWKEFNVTTKSGTIVPSEWCNIQLADNTMIGVGIDLRERKAAEEELKTLNETLEDQVAERTAIAERRAEDLSRLAAELSEAEHRERKRLARLLHDDLQQLLLAVKLRLPVLVESDASQLDEHVQKLDALVSECLSTSRNLTQELSPPVIEYGSLVEIIEWLGQWFGEKHGLAVAIHTDGTMPPIPEYLRVFLFDAARELLFNVVKHSGNLEARVGMAAHGKHLTVQVEDDGKGFDPQAVAARLRQPEGFGLFHIRERLEALGGCLDIQNGRSGGACFQMIVPLADSAATEPAAPRAPAITRPRRPGTRHGTIRLLVVDDHEVVREGMVGLLHRHPDLEVIGEAANGKEAIERAGALKPDAIVMDVDMPAMNGIDATRHIKQQYAEIVIVGLSLHEEEGVRRAMAEAGADGYVSKHAPAQELVEAVRHLCR